MGAQASARTYCVARRNCDRKHIPEGALLGTAQNADTNPALSKASYTNSLYNSLYNIQLVIYNLNLNPLNNRHHSPNAHPC
jgi:hypothetical protein